MSDVQVNPIGTPGKKRGDKERAAWLVELLSNLPGLSIQAPSKQNRFKLSCHVDGRRDTAAIQGVEANRLKKAGALA